MFGHFAKECWSNKERKSQEANIVKGDSDDQHVLMASEFHGGYLIDWWYVDISC